MTRRDRPEPPADLDRTAREALARLEAHDADELRAIGRYLEELAAWSDSVDGDPNAPTETGSISGDGSDVGESGADGSPTPDHEYPDDVPERAEVTVKEIGDTTYYYYQWRDGDRIESKTIQR